MKKVFNSLIIIISLFLFFSCNKEKIDSQNILPQKYAYVGEKNGQSIFLNTIEGKAIYVNNKNQVSDYVDLDINVIEIDKIRNDKEIIKSFQQAYDWGKQKITNTRYSINLKVRYYNDNLLYILEMEPYDANLYRLANTIKIYFVDENNFTLETIKTISWNSRLNNEGKIAELVTSGSLPITLDNLLEIEWWYPVWE